jgi:hypothetical protein
MSFFDISPMGGISVGGQMRGKRGMMRGGIPVGGVPVGGAAMMNMMPMGYHQMLMPNMEMGGISVGGKMSKEELKASRLLRKESLDSLAKRVQANHVANGLKKPSMAAARDIAKLEMLQEKVDSRFQPQSVAKGPRITKKELNKRLSNMRRGEMAKVNERVAVVQSQLGEKGLSQAQLASISAILKAEGYGIYDFQGGGFFDDLYSGLKNVGSTALQMAPSLLPLVF